MLHTETVRQCALALAWTIGLSALFLIWYSAEKWWLLLPDHYRFVRGPIFGPVLLIGIPHIVIGYAFLATSRKVTRRGLRGYTILGLLTAVALGLCWLYGAIGGPEAFKQMGLPFVGIYFTVHHLRDEIFFYQVHGDQPRDMDPARTTRFLATIMWIIMTVMGTVGIFGYDVYNHGKVPPRTGPLDYVFPASAGSSGRALVMALVGAAIIWLLLRRWSRGESIGFREMLPYHRPMLVVYGLFLLVALFGTKWLLPLIVLWHVLEWFIFAARQTGLREATAPAPRSWWNRVRGTRRGFIAFHAGLSAVVFILMMYWTYVEAKTGPLTHVVSLEAFFYWTIFHVTISFYPR